MALPPPPAGYVPPTVNAPSNDLFLARAQAFGLKKPAAPAPAAAAPAPASDVPPPLPPLPPNLPPLPPGAGGGMPLAMAEPDAPSALPGAAGGSGSVAAAAAGVAALSIAGDGSAGAHAGGGGGSGGGSAAAAAAASAERQQKLNASLQGPKVARKPDIDTLPKKPTPAVHIPAGATPHEKMTLAGDAAFAAEMGAVFDKIEAAQNAQDVKAGKSITCGVCQKPLRTNPPTQLVEAGDESYHEQCFKCHGCGKKLSGEVLTIGGKFYHTPCLVCRHCKCSLVGADFHVSPVNDQLYCKLHARVATGGNTCAGCHKPIPGTETAVSAGDKTYHPACFVCAYCSESLSGKQCFIKDGDAYCENDYKTLFGVRCGGCKELITGGQCLTVGEKKVRFHPNCFACANGECKVPLRGLPFFFKADNVYCAKHK